MDKKGSDADVIFNRASVALAKSQRLIASWLPPKSAEERAKEKSEEELEREEKEIFTPVPELLGVGAPIPKDVTDSTLKRRELSSNDKLLQQLIGKKAAKAHIASKQVAAKQNAPGSKPGAVPQKAVPRQESEDEEEGRSSAFKSKKRKLHASIANRIEENVVIQNDPEDEPSNSKADADVVQQPQPQAGGEQKRARLSRDDDSSEDNSRSKSKPKAGSYLDEILAARSKKKKKKKQGNHNSTG